MPLRNVATTFTIEQQRLEINNLAGDVNNIATGVTNVGTAATANALAAGATGADLTLSGTLTVNGTQTILNTETLQVEDKEIVIGNVATPTDATAHGGGWKLKGANNKTITYNQTGDKWVSNKDFEAPNLIGAVSGVTGSPATVAGNLQFIQGTPELEFNNGGARLTVQAANSLSVHTGGGIGTTTSEVARFTNTGLSITGGLLETQGGQGYADSASSLATSVTKAAFRVKGSNNSSDSLWMGVETTDANPYIQGSNGVGNLAKALLLNPHGGRVGIGKTASAQRTLDIQTEDGENGFCLNSIGTPANYHFDIRDDNVVVTRIDSSGRLLLGTSTEGRDTYGEKFTIADSGHCGMTIRSGATSYGILHFSDGTSGAAEYDGMVEYLHGASPRMRLFAGGKYNIVLNGGGSTVLNHNENPKLETTSSGVTVTGNVSDEKGNLRSVPTSPLSGTHAGGYVMLASDVGKCVSMSGDVTLQSASGGGPFGGGDVITILNASGSAITLNQGTGLTLYDSGTGNTGNRTLGARGMATVIYMYGGNTAYISGAQLT